MFGNSSKLARRFWRGRRGNPVKGASEGAAPFQLGTPSPEDRLPRPGSAQTGCGNEACHNLASGEGQPKPQFLYRRLAQPSSTPLLSLHVPTVRFMPRMETWRWLADVQIWWGLPAICWLAGLWLPSKSNEMCNRAIELFSSLAARPGTLNPSSLSLLAQGRAHPAVSNFSLLCLLQFLDHALFGQLDHGVSISTS